MSILDLQHGIHPNVASADYHARHFGLVSKSALDLVRRSPMHFKAHLDGVEQESTPALFLGTATHCAVLEPDVFASTYAVAPDFGDCRTKEGKARRDAWRAENAGRISLSCEDAKAIAGMAAAVRAHPLAARMFSDGASELTLRWKDAETGLEAKARADYYREDLALAIDLKTTQDASPSAFAKSCANFRYAAQDFFYRSGFDAVGAPLRAFLFVAVEKAPPHAVAIYRLDEDALAKGRRAVVEDMRTLAECIARDTWPGFPETIQELSLPSWAT